MPGFGSADNRFGPSSYIVGTTLGDGCNFTSVGNAIAQAVVDGHTSANPTTILVRPGTYSGFTMAPGVLVEGVCAGSAFSNTSSISGNVVIDSTTVGGSTYALKNLNITDPGDALIVQGVATAIFVDIANCSISGTRGIVIGNTSGTLSQFALRECRIVGSSIAVDLQQHNTVFSEQSTYQGGSVFVMSGDSRAALFDCALDANVDYGFQLTGSVNRVNLNFTNINSPQECIIGTNNNEVVQVTHCTFTASAASGNYIDAVDNFEFYNLALKGSALVNNAIATSFIDWQPHAGSSASAVLPGAVRGTSCFDSTQFTVTDGFVKIDGTAFIGTLTPDSGGPLSPAAGNINIFGGPGVTTSQSGGDLYINAVVYEEVVGNTQTVVDHGYFASVVGITLTLPVAPAVGEVVEIVAVDSPIIVQAQPGELIQIGASQSSAGGTATSSNVGATLVLRYFATSGRWYATSSVPSWVLA